MAWRTALLDVSAFVNETGGGILTPEQRCRLLDAIPTIWHANKAAGCSEDEWRRALRYPSESWETVKPSFADVLTLPGGAWGLPEMAKEAARQSVESQKQAERGRSGGQARAKRSLSECLASESESSSESVSESKTTHLVPDGTEREASLKRKAEKQANKDWAEAFENIFWPDYRALKGDFPNPKGPAREIWNSVLEPSQELFDRIMDDFRRDERAWRERKEPQYVPHARKWLHDRIIRGRYVGD